ncbi:MAG: hypothetical protein BZY81_08370 [SAR202 cluster bacterium Io17-Chloro-G4]|nr:MAG: hypothetical protein BZY81_08370 [SAR202 cluster bacterium Io17-Chloro-G4]
MPEESRLSKEAFLFMAESAGIDVTGEHVDELFSIVQATLAGLDSLKEIDVTDAEPDMSFAPDGA